MLKTSATNLRNNLFDYLEKVLNGEIIVIYRNKKEVAKLIPPNISNWRDQVKTKVKIRVSPEKLIEPFEDIWAEAAGVW